MHRKAFITQSNYIPWKGYFDAINEADYFVIYDHVQYTKGDWRNRNRIKQKNGTYWLTIPVLYQDIHQKIDQTKVADKEWMIKHWRLLFANYIHAPFFKFYQPIFEPLYKSIRTDNLSEINQIFIKEICQLLGVKTEILIDSDLDISEPDRVMKLVKLCQQLGCEEYILGPSAKNYIDESKFAEAGITIKWLDYSGYPVYEQVHPPFEHNVTILDLFFNVGENTKKFMKSFH